MGMVLAFEICGGEVGEGTILDAVSASDALRAGAVGSEAVDGIPDGGADEVGMIEGPVPVSICWGGENAGGMEGKGGRHTGGCRCSCSECVGLVRRCE